MTYAGKVGELVLPRTSCFPFVPLFLCNPFFRLLNPLQLLNKFENIGHAKLYVISTFWSLILGLQLRFV
jgi:hypothetical protein